ncbi:MAG: TVP38/TMEM64 family protein [Chloroflexi bacterium]|nr:TVP38/TMEM64 family protein [Chloroflexota bacterium]
MKRTPPVPVIALALFGVTYVMLGWFFGPPTPIERELATVTSTIVRGDANALRDYVDAFGGWAPIVAVAVMVVQAVFLPIPGFVILFANGLVFGVLWGTVVSLVGFGLSGTICFWITRRLGRHRVEWLAERLRLTTIDAWLTRWGAPAVVGLRLNPGFAFDGVSYAAGLTGMRYAPFLAASLLGSLPQTIVFVYLGERANEYLWLIMVVGIVLAAATAFVGLFLTNRIPGRVGDALVDAAGDGEDEGEDGAESAVVDDSRSREVG